MINYKQLIFSFVICCNFLLCNGQDGAVNVERYPFVNDEFNNIQFMKDSLDFYSFFRKLDKLVTTGKGKLNIVHFGGSHVQADIWTGKMRNNFNELINQKQAARGWVYPYKMGHSKNNNPSNYTFEWTGKWDGCRAVFANCSGNFGLSAMQTTTYDSNSNFTLTLKPQGKIEYLFDRIKVFYEMHHQSYKIVLDSNYKALQIIDNKLAGYTEFVFEKPMSQVKFQLKKTDSLQNTFRLFGLFTDLDAPGINYNAIGVNGASVPTYLRCALLEQQLAVVQPDLVIFSIGINDAFDPNFCQSCFERNYEELIKKVKKACPNAAILFTTNTDSYKRTKKNKFYQNITGLEVKAAMRNLSYKYNTGVWDLFSVMGGLGSIQFWCKNGMANCGDLVHLRPAGYQLVGDLMFVSLIKKFEEYLKQPIAKIKHE